MAKKSVKVVDGDEPVEKEVLAAAIVRMSEAAQKLARMGINERAVVVLLHDSISARMNGGRMHKPSRNDIRDVLEAMKELQRRYCR